MPTPQLPLIILAGFDPRPAVLPASGADKHPLVGSKGIDIRIGDRALIDLLIERLRASGAFDPIYIGGPREAYGDEREDAQVIDTQGSFGHNIAVTIGEVSRRHPGSPIALTTCDILPEVEDLRVAMADYARRAPVDFWFPMIQAPMDPSDLGASAWKPQYHVVPAPGVDPVSVLPGHLIVVQPDACRIPLVLRAFNLAYRTRNRGVVHRLVVMVGGVVLSMATADLRNLFAGRVPTLTVSILWHAVALARRLRGSSATPEELAHHVRRIFVRRRHRRRHPGQRGAFVVLDTVSLAKDIDTEEEAAEMSRSLRERMRRMRSRQRKKSSASNRRPGGIKA